MSAWIRGIVTSVLLTAALLFPRLAWAQEMALGSQSLRGYWHVFIAYALAWVMIFAWLVSVYRRMGRLEGNKDEG